MVTPSALDHCSTLVTVQGHFDKVWCCGKSASSLPGAFHRKAAKCHGIRAIFYEAVLSSENLFVGASGWKTRITPAVHADDPLNLVRVFMFRRFRCTARSDWERDWR